MCEESDAFAGHVIMFIHLVLISLFSALGLSGESDALGGESP